MNVNWNIFFAVTIGLLTVLGAGLAGHLAARETWHKWFFWGTGLLIVLLIYFQARAYKEPPTAREIALAVQELSSKKPDVVKTDYKPNDEKPVPAPTLAPNNHAHKKPPPTKQTPEEQPKVQPTVATLNLTQSAKTSTRADAPFETAVIVQTTQSFASLKLVLQCDKPLIDGRAGLANAASMQMMTNSGIVKDHPNVFFFSYGSSVPPFGPANPLEIDVWSKEAVVCNQAATF